MNNRYLSHRPFLVVQTFYRPAKGVRTERARWAEEQSNWEAFEQPSVVDRINEKHLRSATVIIDVLRDRFVKNRYAEGDQETIRQHYLTKYKGQIEEGVRVWINSVGHKAAMAATANGATPAPVAELTA